MKNIEQLSLSFLLLFTVSVYAQITEKSFFIGHSLTDQIPDMVKSLADDHPDVSFDWVFQSIPGSPLQWNWNNGSTYNPIPPHYYGYNHPTQGLPNGTFTQLILTESVPRYPGNINETYEYSENFYEYAHDFNSNTRVFVYEVWHCLDSGTPTGCDFDVDSNPWRQRLDDDLAMWESVVDNLNNTFNPEVLVCLVPGGQGLANLYDAIQAGTVPGITSIDELFEDQIHLTDVGKYFIACIHFASLFNTSPLGLTHQLQNWWGGNFTAPTLQQAHRFQEIAWQTVQNYPNSCLNILSTEAHSSAIEKVIVTPNPTSNSIKIKTNENITVINLFDLNGRKLISIENQPIEKIVDLSHLPNGIYFLELSLNSYKQTFKILKK